MNPVYRKILVISLAGIGDTLLATPLMRELRRAFPEAVIDVFVMWTGAKSVLEDNPCVTRIWQHNLITSGAVESLKVLRNLRAERYDLSINTFPQSRRHYRIVARLIGAAVRLSHRYDHHGFLDSWLVTHTVGQDYSQHAVHNNLNLLSLISLEPQLSERDPFMVISSSSQVWADMFCVAQGLGARRLIGVHVGSGTTKNLALRRWPLDLFSQFIRKAVVQNPGIGVLLFGSPEDAAAHHAVLRETEGLPVYAPPTPSLSHAAALIRRCQAFVSVDTALMHVAAAMKVPRQIVIETPTFNKTVEPFQRPYLLIKNPSLSGSNLDRYRYDGRGIRGTPAEIEQCMRAVTVEQVLEAVRENP